MENQASKGDWGPLGGRVSLAGGAPLDELCFGDREFNVQDATFSRQDLEDALQTSNVGVV